MLLPDWLLLNRPQPQPAITIDSSIGVHKLLLDGMVMVMVMVGDGR
jgi:hypothetical protein